MVESNETNELVITRTFNAPRELVFKVWSEADHLKHWWGPQGFDIHVFKLEFRPGGVFHFSMRSADGQEMWAKFVYREIVTPEKIVYVNSFSDAEGNITRAPFLPTFPLEVLNTFTFSEHDGKTTLTFQGSPIQATEDELEVFKSMYGSMQQGYGATFDQLAEYLAGF